VKTASEMTYTVSGGALNSTPTPTPDPAARGRVSLCRRCHVQRWAGARRTAPSSLARSTAHLLPAAVCRTRDPSLPNRRPPSNALCKLTFIRSLSINILIEHHLTFLRCIALLYFAIRLVSRKSANKRIYLSIYPRKLIVKCP